MIKRNELNAQPSRRKASVVAKRRRRLSVEGLEKRELLAGGLGLPDGVPIYTAPRNIGAVPASIVFEQEDQANIGTNDFFNQAEFVNLGTGPGQLDTIDLSGTLNLSIGTTVPPVFSSDLDNFRVSLRAGDVLDIALQGTAGSFTVQNAAGQLLYGVDDNQALFLPADSPLQTEGNAVFAQVIPEDGDYIITVAPIDTTGAYTMGMRAYRPIIESFPSGTKPVLFVDFDGAIYPRTVFGVPLGGVVRVPGLRESLPLLGIQQQDDATLNRLIDLTMAEVNRQFAFLGQVGNNGDFDSTGNPGDFGITILNSRDHADPGFNPLVTRVILGGTVADIEQDTIGLSSTIDIGNFSLDDIVIAALDSVLDIADEPVRAPSASLVDVMGKFLAFLVSHESGHSFGMRHTFSQNSINNIMDEGPGADFGQVVGSGPDGIFGTIDDQPTNFVRDEFSRAEGLSGFNDTARSLANTLATGTAGGGVVVVGGGVGGRVFRDANGDGIVGTGETGIQGVTVFADANGNRQVDTNEVRTVTSADGTYALNVSGGSVNIVALAPAGSSPTTPTSVTTNVTTGVPSTVNFGFATTPVVDSPDVTGTVFVDNDGDGVRDSVDSGLSGVFVYADLDGDNRPDLGEPNTRTSANGSFSLDFPGPGSYTVRVVAPAGFEQTLPDPDSEDGEYNVVFNGTSVNANTNFGFLPSRDFGDAPDTYGTTVSANGASHGLVSGLRLGATVDREINGQPTSGANGDDTNGAIDDEDGVQLLTPLAPGDAASFRVTATNTSGVPAFLQAFMDFNRDGDFLDVGEQIVTDLPVASGSVATAIPVTVNVPANASIGSTFVRFRLSQQSGVGPTGFVTSGEVEDYTFPILNAAEIANDDTFSVPRNTLSTNLPLLANDFQTDDNPLFIDALNTSGTVGQVVRANDQQSVFYTPPNGFTGRDVFSYSVVDSFGSRSTATVVVNVTFQSNVPIAVDDTFEISQDSSQRPLNVLDNDVPSLSGGISITSVTPGSAGGNIQIIGGGQSLRYTPPIGFTGTEEFTYSIQDSAGSVSSARVTVNLLPGSRNDDVVAFSVGIFDPVNINVPVTNVRVGDEFLLRVSVDDLRLAVSNPGVASAFLDLLYTDELVSTLNTDNTDDFPFDITFGQFFTRADGLQRANAQTPGLIDEVGGVQPITRQQSHDGPVELFSIRLRAVSPGVAQFAANPADDPASETTVLSSDTALLARQLRLGRTELLIVPPTGNFSSAIDDAFPDGRDSNGQLISASSAQPAVIDVLANDNLGPSGIVREFGLVTNPSLGSVVIDDNGTPGNQNDDFFSYRANVGATGLERFTYLLVTEDNIRSTAEVTIDLGNAPNNPDLVAIDFQLVGADGVTPISSVGVGDRFGVQVNVEDLRSLGVTSVFAGYLDVLYDQGIIRPADTIAGDEFNFDVDFGDAFNADAGVGTASRPGIIDEFGTLRLQQSVGNNPERLATLFFDAIAPGTANIVGSPADSFPFQDTLLVSEDDPVEVSRIRYDKVTITVGSGFGSVSALQNPNLAQDVNNDGAVSPIDALLIINSMSRTTSALGEGEQGVGSPAATFYTDVNGDSRVTVLDALQVINYLSRNAGNRGIASEGEFVIAQPIGSSATDLASDAANDAIFAELDQSDSIMDASGANRNDAQTTRVVVQSTDDDNDADEGDVLDLLADDVSGLWS